MEIKASLEGLAVLPCDINAVIQPHGIQWFRGDNEMPVYMKFGSSPPATNQQFMGKLTLSAILNIL